MTKILKLDTVDHRILEELQRDARLPMPMLAERAGLSSPACYRRVRRLRETGAIEREAAVVAPRTLGWPLLMIVLVILERETARTMDEIRAKLDREEAVLEAWHITGEYDLAVRIIARDMEDYEDLAHRIFVTDEHVRSFKTLVVLRQAKSAAIIPAAGNPDALD